MDHKIISLILRLKLYAMSRPWRISLSVIFIIWLLAAIAIPGLLVIVPALLLIFTWMKPTKDNIKKIIKNKKYIIFKLKKFLNLYKRPEHHVKNRNNRKKKGKKIETLRKMLHLSKKK